MVEQKPHSASEYNSETTELIVRTSLHLATVLGDFKEDIVIVGGMVPYFLVDQKNQPYEQQHMGSLDVDIGLHVALLNEERYEEIAVRLKGAGFAPGTNDKGNLTRQSWRHSKHSNAVVEFLMDADGEPSKLQNLTGELAALIIPGIKLAFRDRQLIHLSGRTLDDAIADRDIYVCGPGAFLVLKALAFQSRAKGKDAYDIYYVARNYGSTVEEISGHIKPLLNEEIAHRGINFLKQNFETLDHNGPIKIAQFLGRGGEEELRADISGAIMGIVRQCDMQE